MMETLKPCPFCGAAAELDTMRGYVYLKSGQPRHGYSIVVYCTNCPAEVSMCHETEDCDYKHMVISHWNGRVAALPERKKI